MLLDHVGAWELAAAADLPPAAVSYFADVCQQAWEHLDRSPIPEAAVAGKMVLVPSGQGKAGWRVDETTAGGTDPARRYGSPQAGAMTVAVVHEAAHRIWFRHLGVKGRATWALGRHGAAYDSRPAKEAFAEAVVQMVLPLGSMGNHDVASGLVGRALAFVGEGEDGPGAALTEDRVRELAAPVPGALTRARARLAALGLA